MKDYFIWINDSPVTVSETVYKAYWKGQRKERYFSEGDIHNKVFYYDALDTEETNGSDIFEDATGISVEETVIRDMEVGNLRSALSQLSKEDSQLVFRIYYYEESLRAISKDMDIPLSTLHYRHKRILQRLKQLLQASPEKPNPIGTAAKA